MVGELGFDVLLARLVDHRKLDVGQLTDVAESEIQAVFDGEPPSPSLLRRLAPVLGLHTADLFVIAAVAVPDDLAPLDPRAGHLVRGLAGKAMKPPVAKRRELRRLAASLPQKMRVHPVRRPMGHGRFLTVPCPGAIPMRMLANRNLGATDIAILFLELTGRYWAASTYGLVGSGRKELTPDLLVDYATLLGMPADDLAALTGMTLPDTSPPRRRSVEEVPELIWDVRRLTAGQVEHVHKHR